jgi:Leucine-rich repeat (LRR) protein
MYLPFFLHSCFTVYILRYILPCTVGGGRRLETLDLSYNPIGDIGIQSLARAISSGNLLSLKNLTLKEVFYFCFILFFKSLF